jgi:hypothetical protein
MKNVINAWGTSAWDQGYRNGSRRFGVRFPAQVEKPDVGTAIERDEVLRTTKTTATKTTTTHRYQRVHFRLLREHVTAWYEVHCPARQTLVREVSVWAPLWTFRPSKITVKQAISVQKSGSVRVRIVYTKHIIYRELWVWQIHVF